MGNRTTITFQSDSEIWSTVETWAEETGYRLKSRSESQRLYQEGSGFLTAPMMLEIAQDGKATRLEAWVRVNLIVRIMGLFLIPSEMGVESGGVRLVAPRKIARSAVNKLLVQLGQQEIP
jgi:hypothetical protein